MVSEPHRIRHGQTMKREMLSSSSTPSRAPSPKFNLERVTKSIKTVSVNYEYHLSFLEKRISFDSVSEQSDVLRLELWVFSVHFFLV